ncbi:two-component system, OmpR family, phosphate regulon sensor histidine kinase PhoR [Caldanaerovirga acetigignens]|uniref:histidine kinase n=1 Tax=Caldanaerovirga acetigignens TaxID=447595 RepID=A0A1M7FUE7_9FIRM|nr:two-component system, OmpR family, phosphate regulon sensor histidine kinase PhoR [Caldanaerovirga acetigignens]
MLKSHFTWNWLLTMMVLALLSLVFGVLNSLYIENIGRNLIVEADFISSSIEGSLNSARYQEVQEMTAMFSSRFSKALVIVDGRGNVMASSGKIKLEDLPLEAVLNGKKYVDKGVVRIVVLRQFRAAVPVASESKTAWAVIVGLLPKDIANIVKVNLLFFVFIFLGALLSTLIWKRVSSLIKPLETMVDVARNFTNGNFSRTVHVNSQSEIGKLSKELNLLAKKLRVTMEENEENKILMNELLESLEDGVLLVDDENKIIFVNASANKIVNLDAKKAVGKKLISVVRHYELNEAVNKAINLGIPVYKEITLLPSDKILKASIIPFKDKREKTAGCIVVVKDLTEIKRIEKMRTDFICNISHELKTPLTSIRGFVETLNDGAYQNPALAKRFLKIIEKEVGRLCRLIDNMLDLSMIEMNQIRLNIKDVCAQEIIKEVGVIFENRLREKDLAYYEKFQEKLPKVKADPDWLRQIFVNLMDNAVKYTPNGGNVWIEAESKGDMVEFRVCDNGRGIPEKDIPRIFERFYRVDKHRAAGNGGSGLGLAIVKHLVKAFGGDIRVESKVNQGSKFIFTLKKA